MDRSESTRLDLRQYSGSLQALRLKSAGLGGSQNPWQGEAIPPPTCKTLSTVRTSAPRGPYHGREEGDKDTLSHEAGRETVRD